MVGFNIEDALYNVELKDNTKAIQNIAENIANSLSKYQTISRELLVGMKKVEDDKQWSNAYKSDKKSSLEEEARARMNALNKSNHELLANLKALAVSSYDNEQKDIHLKNMEVVKAHGLDTDEDKINTLTAAINKKDVLLTKFILKKAEEDNNVMLRAKLDEQYKNSTFGITEMGVEEVINSFIAFEKTLNSPSTIGYDSGVLLVENMAKKILKAAGLL